MEYKGEFPISPREAHRRKNTKTKYSPEWKEHLRKEKSKQRKANTMRFTVEELFYTPCIYFLKVDENIVYIGQTESLMTRISQHYIENIKIFTHFDAKFFEGSNKQRLAEEKRLIKIHRPTYNKVHNKQGEEIVHEIVKPKANIELLKAKFNNK